MPMIVLSCQQCDEQQFQTLPYVHYTIFSLALLLDHILVLKKLRVRLAYILLRIIDFFLYVSSNVDILE